MSNNNEILKNGTRVILVDSTEEVIAGYAKGWYTLEDGRKIRGNKIDRIIVDDYDELEEGKKKSKASMAQALAMHRGQYVKTKSAKGKPTAICGDEVSTILSGLEVEVALEVAAWAIDVPADELYTRYEHLNPGQQRMNAGNLIRGAIKKELVTINDLKKYFK